MVRLSKYSIVNVFCNFVALIQVVTRVADIEARELLKQSSMPEGLAGTMAPVEFLDLMEYIASLK